MINNASRSMPDIAAHIKAMEKAKSGMLMDIAKVFDIMAGGKTSESAEECIADLIINAYLLSARLGIDFQSIDEIAANKLKLLIIQDESGMYPYDEIKVRFNKG